MNLLRPQSLCNVAGADRGTCAKYSSNSDSFILGSPVASGAPVTLTAVGVDPAGGALTFNWTAPAGIILTVLPAPDGSLQTFTAPLVPELTASLSLTFQVTATSATSGLISAPVNVTVVVNPQTDIVIVTSAIYLTRKARLGVTATDFTPGVTLTVTLDIINPATGLPVSAVMGQAIPGPAEGSSISKSITYRHRTSSPSPRAVEESQPQALRACAKSIKRLPGFGSAALKH